MFPLARRRSRLKGARMLSRRSLIRSGLLSFPAVHFGGRIASGKLRSDDNQEVKSPPTRPFVVELPIIPVAQAVPTLNPAPDINPVAGEAPRAPHQRWNEFLPKKFYDIHEREADHSFHPDLPLSKIWGYNGIFPGPTFHARYGEPIVVRFRNDLPANHVGFGSPEITTHLHGGHTASETDGWPGDFYASGVHESCPAQVPFPIVKLWTFAVLPVLPEFRPTIHPNLKRWEPATATPDCGQCAAKCGRARGCDHRLLQLPYWGPDLPLEPLGARRWARPERRPAESGYAAPAV